jgi:anti-sigma regulatory factor (Ser/Thr protein kinase)
LFAGLGPVRALPTAARLARTFVRTIIGDWGLTCLSEDCELVISELIANVVQAATATSGRAWPEAGDLLPMLWVRLLSDGVRLRAEVWDNLPPAAGFPEPRRPASSEESGRGLGIVRALSLDWGWDTDRVPGRPHCRTAKRVWAILEKS